MPNRITAPQNPFPGLYDAYWTNVVYPHTMEEKPKVEYRGAQKNPLLYALQQLMSPATQQFVQTPSVPFAPQGAARLPAVQPARPVAQRPVARSPWGGTSAGGYQPQMGAYAPRRSPLEERLRRLRGGM